MRTIEWASQFKKDYKRESKGQHRADLDESLFPVVELLANDKPLEPRHRDHALTGDWKDHRDCHIKPDLVLISEAGCQAVAARTPGLSQRAGVVTAVRMAHLGTRRVEPCGTPWHKPSN